MAIFENFKVSDGSPIYQQLLRHVRQGIASGAVTDGEELPSRRVLSAMLGVNPATVQKAYRLLEEEGIVTSRAGAKSCVSVTAEQVSAMQRALFEEEVLSAVRAMKHMGMERAEAEELLKKLWEGEAE